MVLYGPTVRPCSIPGYPPVPVDPYIPPTHPCTPGARGTLSMSADISVVIQIHIEWERDDPEHRGVRCEGGYSGI